jgi:decaprenylphospho-beta-D-erythro-pentofuranosid-2-ulose 2-reductase
MKRILIMGATSAIAQATARAFAARGDALCLAGRDARALEALAEDLRLRGARTADIAVVDARDLLEISLLPGRAAASLGGLDQALIAHGTLPEQAITAESVELLQEAFVVNALSVMALSLALARIFCAQGHGVIAAISSVAGDRGRQSNYLYGSAKSSVSTFLSGMRQQLHGRGVRVVTIKPGFVDTPMTAAFPKGALWSKPEAVARDICHAMDHGTPVVYTPWFWRTIMLVVRSVPESIFRRLRI